MNKPISRVDVELSKHFGTGEFRNPDDKIAKQVFIPMKVVHRGPPSGFKRWDGPACLALLRKYKIDAENFSTWYRAKHRPGYWLVYHGELATPKSLRLIEKDA